MERDMLDDGDYFLVVDNKLRIAREQSRNVEDGSITADLYRNLEDYRSGWVMEFDFKFWCCPN